MTIEYRIAEQRCVRSRGADSTRGPMYASSALKMMMVFMMIVKLMLMMTVMMIVTAMTMMIVMMVTITMTTMMKM